MDWKCLYFLSLISIPSLTYAATADVSGTYIIHMDAASKPAPFANPQDWHESILSSLSTESETDPPPTHLYTYIHAMSGFSAVLSPSHLRNLGLLPGYIASRPERYGQLHTTHTPKFLGLNRASGLWPASKFGDGAIIGIIDTGIWPESESFNDKGMPPVPEGWKGRCENGTQCNRKLIGAQSFLKGMKARRSVPTNDYGSPRDHHGHGTHTSSTAAGARVRGTSYFGYAEGTATGIAPMARISMYKAVFDDGAAAESDVLAAMDRAIADGVGLMSLSLGFFKTPYFEDAIAIGAFAAMEKGIFVSCSAGNAGPHAYTVINGAPWLTSVGAGTIDRDYFATIALDDGNGKTTTTIQGRSLYPESIFISNVSLYFGSGNTSKESCEYLALDPEAVAGKIVLCSSNSDTNVEAQMLEVSRAGPEGAIFVTDYGQYLNAEDFFMPFVAVNLRDGEVIKEYVTKARTSPAVDVTFILTKLGIRPAPQVIDFSSRGPSRISPGILKPDILAPGVNILAAWVPNRGFAPIGNDDYLVTDYALVSGTSMASPHVIGIAAMLRSVHPEWSPAAIRSAIMTTADITDNSGGPIVDMIAETAATPLDFGAGHVNPNKAMDPGLVYDIAVDDYMNFICGLNYTSQQIGIITNKANYSCATTRANLDLNYPSFAIILDTNSSSRVFRRILTNVGDRNTSYRAMVKAPKGMKVAVEPPVLSFEGKFDKREFAMRVDIDLDSEVTVKSLDYIGNYGFLSWLEIGGKHVVRSPIVSAFAP